MKLIEQKRDLFSLDTNYTLIHCISLDCAMGAGIAKKFNEQYPDMKTMLLETIKQNNITHPYSIMYYNNINLNIEDKDNQKIINMITKEFYWNKPTYEDFTKSLEGVKKFCKKYNLKYIAMPKIGCGLDKLNWNKVKNIIKDIFNDLDIEILICYI